VLHEISFFIFLFRNCRTTLFSNVNIEIQIELVDACNYYWVIR